MIKLFVPLANLLTILLLQLFPGGVSVKMDVPSEVTAGSEFQVSITFSKGDLEGFSRLQQSLPAGLNASSIQSSNADFSFTEKRVRMIWLRTPKSKDITVSYRIQVDERLKGTFTLGGLYSYIEDNERKSVEIEPVSIQIIPSSSVDPSHIVDVNDYDRLVMPHALPVEGNAALVACIRQKPVPDAQGGYVVNLLVSKGTRQQFAKIEEDVPPGYTAIAQQTRDGIFTFKSGKAKFLWMNLPAESYYLVSYRLIPKNQARLPEPDLRGTFSYLVEERTVSLPVAQKDIDLASLNGDEVGSLMAQVLSEPAVQQTSQTDLAENTTPSAGPDRTNKQTGKKVRETSKKGGQELAPERGVYYRIQLAAGHKAVNPRQYFRKLKIDREIKREEHDGWHKYSVGSFTDYKQARDYRMQIWNSTPVKDAFVTAYNEGQRITVQEALMITEQQWHK